jgi:hypothetical protein
LDREHNAGEIARRVGISRQHFFTWMGVLNQEGLGGLLRRRHGGGKKTVSGWPATSSFSRRIVKSWRDVFFKIWIRTAALDT